MAIRIIIPEGFIKVTGLNAQAAWLYLKQGVTVVRIKGGRRAGTYCPLYCLPYMLKRSDTRQRAARAFRTIASPCFPEHYRVELKALALRWLTEFSRLGEGWEDVEIPEGHNVDLLALTHAFVGATRKLEIAAGVQPQQDIGL